MRSIYLQFGQNRKTNIKQQLIDLNKRVIDWCVKEIISNIMQYDSYKETISTLPMPLERSQLPSQKGTRVLEIKSFISLAPSYEAILESTLKLSINIVEFLSNDNFNAVSLANNKSLKPLSKSMYNLVE